MKHHVITYWSFYKYILIIAALSLDYFFVSEIGFTFHKEIDLELNYLEEAKKEYQNKLKDLFWLSNTVNTDEGIEEIARTRFFFKKPNEDIFIILPAKKQWEKKKKRHWKKLFAVQRADISSTRFRSILGYSTIP